MRTIKLEFSNSEDLSKLLQDKVFLQSIEYLNPDNTINSNSIILIDPVSTHYYLDTEIVVLSIFARGINRILFPNIDNTIEYINPIVNQQKGGLVVNGKIIISSTDIQITL